jgi:2-polyprenyl-3-methyl-5-hydroxy-6-metoxy-1,4-benzoquinol methylase
MKIRKHCPVCDAVERKNCFVINEYDIKRCSACGSMYVVTLPTPEALAAIYTSDSYYELPPDSMRRIVEENQRRLNLIQNIKPTGRFLDIGCAQGLLLDEANQAGYQTFGIEPTWKNAEEAAKKGHSISNNRLDEFVDQCGEDRFDVITCLDVIEHIDNPKAFLNLASSLLAQDGLMVVSTPNFSCIVERLLGANAPYMTPPEHVTFLTVNGMRQLAFACGLNVLSFHTFGNLIPAEMERSIKRYLPKPLHSFGALIKPVIWFSFWLMNWMKMGLEQEVYLTKVSQPSKL